MFRMTNPVRDYAWGSTTAFSRLFGMPAEGPQAELWMGAHPAAPSTVVRDGRPTALEGLPFLFKVLAADRPLSIQTHPTRERARAGYAAEEAAGIPVDSPQRRYVDAEHKPELVVAVEDFSALCGFRPGDEAADDVAAARELMGRGEGGAAAQAAMTHLEERLRAGRLEDALALILRTEPEAFARAADSVVAALGAMADSAPAGGLSGAAVDTLRRAGVAFPGDPGVIVTLLLNRVDLSPGEALFLPAGNLHAYLHGVAVEIMANSDNVLRGGLTSKLVDVHELLAVTEAEVLPVPWCPPAQPAPGRAVYTPDCEEFQLERLTVPADHDADCMRLSPDGPGVLLCLRGTLRAEREGGVGDRAPGEGTDVLELRAGESAFLAPGETVRIRPLGPGEEPLEAYLASPGRRPDATG